MKLQSFGPTTCPGTERGGLCPLLRKTKKIFAFSMDWVLKPQEF